MMMSLGRFGVYASLCTCLSMRSIKLYRSYAMRHQGSVQQRERSVNYETSFMFPGQGVQHIGMAHSVCEYGKSRLLFERASNILGYDLLDKINNGPKEELDSTIISQPSIFVTTMAILEKLKFTNPEVYQACTATFGLSLGEYSALCFAGCFSFEDGVKLTKARGEAMQSASNMEETGMIAVIGLDEIEILRLCETVTQKSGKYITIGNFLTSNNFALSGHIEACRLVKEIGKTFGAKLVVPLPVSGAFHSHYMESAVPILRSALSNTELMEPRISVLSNVNAKPYESVEDIRNSLLNQVICPVKWKTIISNMTSSASFEKAYEIGPGNVCKGTVKAVRKDAIVQNIF